MGGKMGQENKIPLWSRLKLRGLIRQLADLGFFVRLLSERKSAEAKYRTVPGEANFLRLPTPPKQLLRLRRLDIRDLMISGFRDGGLKDVSL